MVWRLHPRRVFFDDCPESSNPWSASFPAAKDILFLLASLSISFGSIYWPLFLFAWLRQIWGSLLLNIIQQPSGLRRLPSKVLPPNPARVMECTSISAAATSAGDTATPFKPIPSTGETNRSLQWEGTGPTDFEEGSRGERSRVIKKKAFTGSSSIGLRRIEGNGPFHQTCSFTLGLPRTKFFRSIFLPLDQGGLRAAGVKAGVGDPGPRDSKGVPTINQPSAVKFEGGEVLRQSSAESGHKYWPLPELPLLFTQSGR